MNITFLLKSDFIFIDIQKRLAIFIDMLFFFIFNTNENLGMNYNIYFINTFFLKNPLKFINIRYIIENNL